MKIMIRLRLLIFTIVSSLYFICVLSSSVDTELIQVNSVVFKLQVESKHPVCVAVNYGISGEEHKRGSWLIFTTPSSAKTHTIPIVRLKSDSDYDYFVLYKRIEAGEECKNKNLLRDGRNKGRLRFTTGPLPQVLADLDLRNVVRNQRESLILASLPYFFFTGRHMFMFAWNQNAEIVWYIEAPHPDNIFTGLGFTGDNEGRIYVNRNDRLTVYNVFGDILSEHVAPNECPIFHHEMFEEKDELEETVIWTLSEELDFWEENQEYQLDDVFALWKLASNEVENVATWNDFIPYTSRTEASDITVPFYEVCQNPNITTPDDWAHANSVTRSKYDQRLLISSARALNKVIAFNPITKELKWQLGGPDSDFTFPDTTDKFYHQHTAHQLRNGDVLVFDNGNTRPEEEGGQYSRAIRLRLDFEQWTARKVWEYRLDEPCFSNCCGSVEQLEDDSYLIDFPFCDANASPATTHVVRVDEEKNVLSSYLLTVSDFVGLYRAQAINTLAGEH